MRPTFWKSCLFVGLVLSCIASAHGQTEPRDDSPAIAGYVTLANGDRMPAKIDSFSGKEFEFGSTLFDETVKLDAESLRSFGFRPMAESGKAPRGTQFQFWLKSGTRLYGSLVSLDETECVLESPYFGKVVLPIASLVRIKQSIPQPSRTAYTSLNWNLSDKSSRPDDQGRIWVPADPRKRLVVPQRLDGTGRFEIDFLCNKKTDFQIQLSNKMGLLISIGVTDGSLVLESDDELSFGEFETVYGAKQLTVDWDGKVLNVLNELGKSLIEAKLDSQTPLSVSIKNEGSDLKINELSTTPTSLPPTVADVSLKQMQVKRLSGEWVAAKTIVADQAAVTLKGQQGSEKIEIAQVDQIWFGVKPAEPNRKTDGGYACWWRQGQRVVFDELQFQGDKLEFTTDEFTSQKFVSNELPAEVFLPNKPAPKTSPTPKAHPTASHDYLLAISGIPFSGSCYEGDTDHPVRWQFYGFLEPVSLNIQRKIEIRRKDNTALAQAKDSPDRLLLDDGSIVPCRVGVADQTGLNFESKQVKTKTVPMNEVRCCFFDSNNIQWKAALTNETVQRALTLPRFADDLPFTHVLIGKNGDLLRGDLVRIGEEEIEFESRFEPLLIPRKNVVGIVAVDASPLGELAADAADEEPREATATELQEDPDQVIMHVDCGNDFIAVGRYVALDSEKAVLDSELLGKVKLDAAGIGKIAFNSRIRNVSALQYFADWQLNTSIEPRWESETEYAADSNQLLDKPAPDFTLSMLEEADVFQLSSHQGKLVVINFWETTSKPSVLGIPEYRSVIQKFSPRDVVFVAPNQGETDSTVRKFLTAENWSSLDIAMDANNEVASKFNVTGIPHLTILDRSGVVRFIRVGYSKRGAAELEEQIRELLAE